MRQARVILSHPSWFCAKCWNIWQPISPDKFLQRSAYFLGRSKGQTILKDFFGSGLRREVDKPRLTGYRGALLREAYRPEVLVDEPHNPEYGSCGETTPFISNLAQWVSLLLGNFIVKAKECSLTNIENMAVPSLHLYLKALPRKWNKLGNGHF